MAESVPRVEDCLVSILCCWDYLSMFRIVYCLFCVVGFLGYRTRVLTLMLIL